MGGHPSKSNEAPVCMSTGCSFRPHPTQGHGYCCFLCKSQPGQHGPQCQRGGANAPGGRPGQCLSPGCGFGAHTTQGHGYCCNLCKAQPCQHGPLCEKRPGAAPSAKGAPAKTVAPQQGKTADLSKKAVNGVDWKPSLMLGKKPVGAKSATLTGTEVIHLEVHKGELFASFGRWMSPVFVKKDWGNMNGLVARLDSANGGWVEDNQGQGPARWATRITCLKSLKWTRDCHGNELSPPVEQLAMLCSTDHHYIMFRDDDNAGAPGNQHVWRAQKYAQMTEGGHTGVARAMVVHEDSVTKIQRLVALQGQDGVVSGVYDPSSGNPGHVIWDPRPERMDLSSHQIQRLPMRPLSLLIIAGALFMSSGPYILKREDGPDPVWRIIHDVTHACGKYGKLEQQVGGIRGMTAVPNPGGTGESILFCWNPNGQSKSWILRSDPVPGGGWSSPVEETDINKLAKQYLGTEQLYYTLAAYNDMRAVKIGNRSANLIGFEIVGRDPKLPMDPNQKKTGYWAGGGVAVRFGPSEYGLVEVGGPRKGPKAVDPLLTAVRCFCVSPFGEDKGSVYFGGYDCNNFPVDNTAWIYKGRLV